MSTLASIEKLLYDRTTIEVTGPNQIRISGSIAVRTPEMEIRPIFERIHRAAIADAIDHLKVDVTELSFVNSSAIRLFLDWVTWLRGCDEPYRMTFHTNDKYTWQRTSFPVMATLAPDLVTVSAQA